MIVVDDRFMYVFEMRSGIHIDDMRSSTSSTAD